MSSSVAETAGLSAVKRVKKEIITIGEGAFELEKPFINVNPKLVGKLAGSLLVARRLEPNGEFAEVLKPHDFRDLPGKSDADEALRHLSVAASQNAVFIPAPPIIGHIEEPSDNPDYFSVRSLEDTTTMLPYTGTDTLSSYLIQAATRIQPDEQ